MIGLFRRTAPLVSRSSGSETLRLDGEGSRALETGRNRLLVTGAMFVLAFAVIAGRLVEVTLLKGTVHIAHHGNSGSDLGVERADVVDRDGVLLATSLPTVSLYANLNKISDKAESARRIAALLPDQSAAEILTKLREQRSVIALRRNLTPRQQYDINALGIPGLYFEKSEKRIYPQGELTAHVVGVTDVDNKGIAGIEASEERELKAGQQPLRLSIDVRVQSIMRHELMHSVEEFHAIGAVGMVMDVHNGEVLAMVSLPDFDPNMRMGSDDPARFNRATKGTYEMGSTFKLFNTAAALDQGIINVNSSFDATHPLEVAGYTIHDDEPRNRWLTVPEILIYSSNIGSARMALALGTDNQRAFMSRLGMTQPTPVELPERAAPQIPNPWREINTMTIGFGHGMAVTPLHMVSAVSALVNGGIYHPATLLKLDDGAQIPAQRVIKPETSRIMRELMRVVVTRGTGSSAEVAGYEVGGKTGTAEKSGVGGYHRKSVLSSFIATFPVSDPRYVVLVMIDEPHGTKESGGFVTAHYNAAPAVGQVVAQIGPLLGMTPVNDSGGTDTARERVAVNAALHGDMPKGLTFAEAR